MGVRKKIEFVEYLFEHAHSVAKCYPTAGAGVSLAKAAGAWAALPATVDVMPANTETAPLAIYCVNIEAVSAVGVYKVALYADGDEIARLTVTCTALKDAQDGVPCKTPIINPTKAIKAAITGSPAGAETIQVSIGYSTY